MLKEIIIAIQSYGQAHRFISRHRLWKWILIPGLIYTILFVVGIYFFWISSNSAIEFLLLKTGVKNWLDRMHDSWLNWFFIMGQVILRLVLLLFYFSLFKYLFLIIEEKEFPFSFRQLLIDMVRATRIALRNMLWQTVYVISILILSLIPLIGWATPVLSLFTECYYFGFSMLDYSSERNKLSAQQSIEFIGRHKGLAIGNGMVFYIMHLIPIVGWVLAPSYAVIAATLSLFHARKSHVIL